MYYTYVLRSFKDNQHYTGFRGVSNKDLSSIRKVFKESAQILFNRVNVQRRTSNKKSALSFIQHSMLDVYPVK